MKWQKDLDHPSGIDIWFTMQGLDSFQSWKHPWLQNQYNIFHMVYNGENLMQSPAGNKLVKVLST